MKSHAYTGEERRKIRLGPKDKERRQLQKNIAYMPVPRCDQCSYWEENNPNNGTCEYPYERDAKMYPDLYDHILTTSDFGCVAWKSR